MTASFDLARFFAVEEPKLRRFLRRIAPAGAAEDLAQDAFARLCAANPATMASPRGFLFRTARNLAIDHMRRRAHAAINAADALDEAPAGEPSVEDELIAAERAGAIEAVVAALPQNERLALLLRKVEGVPPGEIAARLGVTERQVQRLVVSAIERAQRQLREVDDNPPDQR